MDTIDSSNSPSARESAHQEESRVAAEERPERFNNHAETFERRSGSDLTNDGDYRQDEDRTIFIGDLPPEFTASEISSIFQPFGSIIDIQVKLIRGIKAPFSYAFVKFETKESAQQAYDTLNGSLSLGGNILRLGWAHRNRSLHVGNLEVTVIEEDLRQLFSEFGELDPVDGVILFRRDIPGYTNYAHINYSTRDAASTARARMNHYELHGRNLRVEWNRSPKKLTETLNQSLVNQMYDGNSNKLIAIPALNLSLVSPSDATTTEGTTGRSTYICSPVISIYVQFETVHESARVSENSIREVFEPFGHVTGCFIKTNYISNNGKRQYGYGFVHFESSPQGQECAQKAAESIGCSPESAYIYKGVSYRCEVSKNYRRATGTLHEDNGDDSNHNSNNNSVYNTPQSTDGSRYRSVVPYSQYDNYNMYENGTYTSRMNSTRHTTPYTDRSRSYSTDTSLSGVYPLPSPSHDTRTIMSYPHLPVFHPNTMNSPYIIPSNVYLTTPLSYDPITGLATPVTAGEVQAITVDNNGQQMTIKQLQHPSGVTYYYYEQPSTTTATTTSTSAATTTNTSTTTTSAEGTCITPDPSTSSTTTHEGSSSQPMSSTEDTTDSTNIGSGISSNSGDANPTGTGDNIDTNATTRNTYTTQQTAVSSNSNVSGSTMTLTRPTPIHTPPVPQYYYAPNTTTPMSHMPHTPMTYVNTPPPITMNNHLHHGMSPLTNTCVTTDIHGNLVYGNTPAIIYMDPTTQQMMMSTMSSPVTGHKHNHPHHHHHTGHPSSIMTPPTTTTTTAAANLYYPPPPNTVTTPTGAPMYYTTPLPANMTPHNITYPSTMTVDSTNNGQCHIQANGVYYSGVSTSINNSNAPMLSPGRDSARNYRQGNTSKPTTTTTITPVYHIDTNGSSSSQTNNNNNNQYTGVTVLKNGLGSPYPALRSPPSQQQQQQQQQYDLNNNTYVNNNNNVTTISNRQNNNAYNNSVQGNNHTNNHYNTYPNHATSTTINQINNNNVASNHNNTYPTTNRLTPPQPQSVSSSQQQMMAMPGPFPLLKNTPANTTYMTPTNNNSTNTSSHVNITGNGYTTAATNTNTYNTNNSISTAMNGSNTPSVTYYNKNSTPSPSSVMYSKSADVRVPTPRNTTIIYPNTKSMTGNSNNNTYNMSGSNNNNNNYHTYMNPNTTTNTATPMNNEPYNITMNDYNHNHNNNGTNYSNHMMYNNTIPSHISSSSSSSSSSSTRTSSSSHTSSVSPTSSILSMNSSTSHPSPLYTTTTNNNNNNSTMTSSSSAVSTRIHPSSSQQ